MFKFLRLFFCFCYISLIVADVPILSLGSGLLERLACVGQVGCRLCRSLRLVVLNGGLDGVLGQEGAVKLNGWQAEFVGNLSVLNLSSFIHYSKGQNRLVHRSV